MKKAEILSRLKEGEKIERILSLSWGQDCPIYKAAAFTEGDDVIYVPDVWLNEIEFQTGDGWDEEAEEKRLRGMLYTGDDILAECGGNRKLAEELFNCLDWQHPSSALDDYPYLGYTEEEWQERYGKTSAELWQTATA